MSDRSSSRNPIVWFFSLLWSGLTWIRRALANLVLLVIILLIVVAISQRKVDTLPDAFGSLSGPFRPVSG